jgi:DNA-binding HxlR family transcriptional regulator
VSIDGLDMRASLATARFVVLLRVRLLLSKRTSEIEARPDSRVSSDETPRQPSTLALLELLGRRWALRILWELRQEPATFQALHTRCDSMSTSVLSQRLTELREAQLVEKDPAGSYRLTEHGSRLLARLDGMDEWTQEWGRLLRAPTAERPGSSR